VRAVQKGHDFYVGVASVLKIEPFTRPPVWLSSLDDLTLAQVLEYFEPDPSLKALSFD